MSTDNEYSMIDSDGNRIHFTEIQKECIDYGGKSAFVTKGTAGSGKSLTMIKRAMKRRKEIIENDLKENILIVTYNKTLSNGIKYILKKNGVEPTDEILEVIHADLLLSKICYNLNLIPKKIKSYYGKGQRSWSSRGKRYNSNQFEPISSKDRITTIKEVLDELSKDSDHRYFKLDPDFWADEILWMYQNGIVDQDDEDQYLDMSRRGRCKTYKVRMTHDGKKIAFNIFNEYNSHIFHKELIEWDRVYALLYRDHIDRIPSQYKYDYIYIDEAQDLTLIKMQIIDELCRNKLEIAMDKNQSLYGHRWGFKDCLGSVPHVKTLTMMHRGTREIDEFSRDLKKVDDSLLDEEDRYDYELSPTSINLLPKIVKCNSSSSEINFIINEIRVLSKRQNATIAILCLNHKDLNVFGKKLKESGIDVDFFRSEGFTALEPGVKLITVYSAKGLGFSYVFVPFFQENVYPRSIENIVNSLKITEYNEDAKITIEETIAEEIAESRRLAYVAITRATGNVYLTYSGNPSPFIGEFDTDHYDLIDESHRKTADFRINKIYSDTKRLTSKPGPRGPFDYDYIYRDQNMNPSIDRESFIKELLSFRKQNDTEESIVKPKTVSKSKIVPKTEPKTVIKTEPEFKSTTTERPKYKYDKNSMKGKLISMLQATNLVYVDLGPRAPIWIIDSPGVMSYIKNLEKLGYSFKYSTKGSKSTQGKAAYYTWLKD